MGLGPEISCNLITINFTFMLMTHSSPAQIFLLHQYTQLPQHLYLNASNTFKLNTSKTEALDLSFTVPPPVLSIPQPSTQLLLLEAQKSFTPTTYIPSTSTCCHFGLQNIVLICPISLSLLPSSPKQPHSSRSHYHHLPATTAF